MKTKTELNIHSSAKNSYMSPEIMRKSRTLICFITVITKSHNHPVGGKKGHASPPRLMNILVKLNHAHASYKVKGVM